MAMHMPPAFGSGRDDPEHSAALKRASRINGRLADESVIFDIDCDGCDRPFVPVTNGQTICRRCRPRETVS